MLGATAVAWGFAAREQFLLIVVTALALVVGILGLVWSLVPELRQRLPASAGKGFAILGSGITAFFIVHFLQIGEPEALEFTILGAKFKGNSSQVVLWLLIHLGLMASITLAGVGGGSKGNGDRQ